MRKWLYIGYGLILTGFSVYSYALVDPNLTFINSPVWTSFRNTMVQLGYHNRMLSWYIFAGLLLGMYGLHIASLRNQIYKKLSPVTLSIIIAMLLALSYPLLSHDLFNYMFDARILTFHGDNPYTHMGLDYPSDEWTRFLQWTHRAYPYGPTFLPITLIPSAAAFGTFILNFVFFKALFAGAYVGSVWMLNKMKPEWALFFATHPLILIEGIVNAHNDILAVLFAFIGIYYLARTHTRSDSKKFQAQLISRLWLAISGGIKYFTAPLIILEPYTKKSYSWMTYAGALGVLGLIMYVSIDGEIQPWYFLNLFALIPYFYALRKHTHILFAGLLLAYYPYIALGGWADQAHVELKHTIILVGLVGQTVYSIYSSLNNRST